MACYNKSGHSLIARTMFVLSELFECKIHNYYNHNNNHDNNYDDETNNSNKKFIIIIYNHQISLFIINH